MFALAASLAVRKAVRAFDEYVHEAASLGAHLGYELPKKAVKMGVTDVEVTMTDKQVALFFPDYMYRQRQRGGASVFEWICSLLAVLIPFAISSAYFFANYAPTQPPYTFEYVLGLMTGFAQAALSIAFVVFAVFLVVVITVVWRMLKIAWPSLANVDPAITFVDGAVREPHWSLSAIYDFICVTIRVTRETVCEQFRHEWFCPAIQPTRIQRVCAIISHTFWAVVPAVRHYTFWRALGLFVALVFLAQRLLRRRTVWKVQLRIESQAFSIARGQKTRAMQETTSDKVAATPIITHVENHVKNAHSHMPVELRDKYLAICLLITSAWADNRVNVVQTTPGEPDTEAVQDNSGEYLGDLGAAKRLLATRTNTCPPNVWRRSVRVIKRTWDQLFVDVQQGRDRTLPGQDEIKEYYSGVVTGPELFDITEGFAGGVEDEIAGVSRHLRQLRSTLTGDYLPKEISQEATDRLNTATDIICRIVSLLANEYFLWILEWALPQKWGNARAVYFQRLVEVAQTVLQPMLTGFVKTCELALPLNKLPRLVGSMGMLCCAKDAAVLCSVEQLFKRFLPHLVVKGITQDGVCARFAAFARRAKRLGLRILSIDMSAMDSSWTEDDRRRVRRVLCAIVDQVASLLDAELQQDYVSQCSARQRALRWMLRYIQVQLLADDSILFSGERSTSIGNRILMLITWSAELLRVYGIEEGTERIEKMFYSPAAAHKTCSDERAPGVVELVPDKVCFADDPAYDNNVGDGDDCTLAIPRDMYASKEEFIIAYEQYYKLVEPCSAWDEGEDMECLSLMCIQSAGKPYFVPKVARNAQRLVAHKIKVKPARHFAEGNPTYLLSPKEYAEIATDLWQRSFALRHSMVSRHLNRAMFEYCYGKVTDMRTVYDDDDRRLGKSDGDLSLAECLQQVRDNAAQSVSPWAMVKATHFASVGALTSSHIKALKREWNESDYTWSMLELTDDLCAAPDVMLDSFPIGPNVALGLGFRQVFVDQLKRQLVKGEGVSPEMSDGTRPGRHEGSVSDGAGAGAMRAATVIVYRGTEVLCGYEPHGKPRAGMITFPSGKAEGEETFEKAAVRELQEEAARDVEPEELSFVREHKLGKLHCKLYCVESCKTNPAAVLTADKLTDLRYRTARSIIDSNAPNKIASCIKEVLRDGEFLPCVFGGAPPLQPTTTFPKNGPGHVAMHRPAPSPGSSCVSNPSFEVKPAAAEADGTGPSQPSDDTHSHVCPMCGEEYSHSHPYTRGFTHVPRAGACPNVKCPHHAGARQKAAGATMSREQGEGRQPPVSNPVVGYGTPHPGKRAGKEKAGKTGGGALSPPSAVSQNAGKSPAAPAESKGKGRGKQSKGKLPKVCDPPAKPQTAEAVETLVPSPPTVPRIVDEVPCVSESSVPRSGGEPERAGISGHQNPDGGATGTPPPGPGELSA